MKNILKQNHKLFLLFILLLGSMTIKAQSGEAGDDNFEFHFDSNDYDDLAYYDGELNSVGVDAWTGGGSSDNSWDYASLYWDFDTNNYIESGSPFHDYSGTNTNTDSSGNPGGTPAPKPPASKIILTKKVKPGQIHTQRVAALRDHNQPATFVSQLMVNGVAVGTVTFSNPQIDANGVEIYTVLTVEVFYDSPVAITNVVLNEIDDRDSQNFTNSSTNGVTIDITGDISNYPTLGLVEFVLPMNETEDLEIITTRNIDESKLEKKDPCVVAKELTVMSNNQTYKKAVEDIKKAAADKVEHSITLGKNDVGEITAAPMLHGVAGSVKVNEKWERAFTVLHNHPSGSAPSAGDILALTEFKTRNNNFDTCFALGGEMYAIAITDLAAAQIFSAKYLANKAPDDDNEYPEFMTNEILAVWEKMDSYNFEAQAKAKAFIVNKYNGGITFFKQNNNGVFYPLTTKEIKQANGIKTYTLIPCI